MTMEARNSLNGGPDSYHLTAKTVDVDIHWNSTESSLAEVVIKIAVDVRANRRLKVLRITDTDEESITLVRCSSRGAALASVLGRAAVDDESWGVEENAVLGEQLRKRIDEEASGVFEELMTGLEELHTQSNGVTDQRAVSVEGSLAEVEASGNGTIEQSLLSQAEAGCSPNGTIVTSAQPKVLSLQKPCSLSETRMSESLMGTPASASIAYHLAPRSNMSPKKARSAPLIASPTSSQSSCTTPLHRSRKREGLAPDSASGCRKVKIPWQSVSREDVLEYERQSPTKRYLTGRERASSPTKQSPPKPSATTAKAKRSLSKSPSMSPGQSPAQDMSGTPELPRQENRPALSFVPELRPTPDQGTTSPTQDYVGAQDVHDWHVPRHLSDAGQEKFSTSTFGGCQPNLETGFSGSSADVPGSVKLAGSRAGCDGADERADASTYLPRTPTQGRVPSAASSAFEDTPRDSSLLSARKLAYGQEILSWRELEPVFADCEEEDVTPLFINSRGLAFVYFPYGFKEGDFELEFEARLRVPKPGEGHWRKVELSGLPQTDDGCVSVTVLIVHPAGGRLNIEYDATSCLVEGSQLQLTRAGLHGQFVNVDPLKVFFRQEQWSVLLESVDIEVNVICTFSLCKEKRALQVCYDAFVQLLGRNTDVFAQEAVVELEILNCPAREDAVVFVNDLAGRHMILRDWSATSKSREAVLSTASTDLAEAFELCITIEKGDLATSFFQLPVILPKSANSRLVSERLTICEPEFPIHADFSTLQLFRGWQHRRRKDGALALHEFSRRTLPSVRPTGLLLQVGVVHATPPRGSLQSASSLPDIAHFVLRGRKAEDRLVAVECEIHIEAPARKDGLLAHVHVPQTGGTWLASPPIVNGSLALQDQVRFDPETRELQVFSRPGTTKEALCSVSLFWWSSVLDREPIFMDGSHRLKLGLQIDLPCLAGKSRRRCRLYVFSDLESAILQWWSKDLPFDQGETVHRQSQELSEGETFAINGACDGMSILVPDWELDSLESTVLESCSPSCRSVAGTLDCYEEGDGELDLELERALAQIGGSGSDDGTLDLELGSQLGFAGDSISIGIGEETRIFTDSPPIMERVLSAPKRWRDSASPAPRSLSSTPFAKSILPADIKAKTEKHYVNIDGILDGVVVFWAVLAAVFACLLLADAHSYSLIGLGDYCGYTNSPSVLLDFSRLSLESIYYNFEEMPPEDARHTGGAVLEQLTTPLTPISSESAQSMRYLHWMETPRTKYAEDEVLFVSLTCSEQEHIDTVRGPVEDLQAIDLPFSRDEETFREDSLEGAGTNDKDDSLAPILLTASTIHTPHRSTASPGLAKLYGIVLWL